MFQVKKIATCVLLVLLMSVTIYANEVSVMVNGQRVNFEGQGPVIVDDRTLVPVRGVFEMLGFEVGWDEVTRRVTLSGDDVVVITIGSAVFTTNGVSYNLDVPAQIIGDRTMLPIRHVLESVGFTVGWDNATRTVLVSGDITSSDDISPVVPLRYLSPDTCPACQRAYNRVWQAYENTNIRVARVDMMGYTFFLDEASLLEIRAELGELFEDYFRAIALELLAWNYSANDIYIHVNAASILSTPADSSVAVEFAAHAIPWRTVAGL